MREVVQLTVRTVERRAVLYRRTAVVVLFAVLLPPIVGVVARSLWPLLVWLVPIPATALFLHLDRSSVKAWACEVRRVAHVRSWHLATVVDALRQLTYLPTATLDGMLTELLSAEHVRDPVVDDAPAPPR